MVGLLSSLRRVRASASARRRPAGGHAPCCGSWAPLDDRLNISPGCASGLEIALAVRAVGHRPRLGPGARTAPSTCCSRSSGSSRVVNAFNLFDNMDGRREHDGARSSRAGIGARRSSTDDTWLAAGGRGALRRVPGLPAAQPGLAGADLPGRRRQHAAGLRGRGARDDRLGGGGAGVAGARRRAAARGRPGPRHRRWSWSRAAAAAPAPDRLAATTSPTARSAACGRPEPWPCRWVPSRP